MNINRIFEDSKKLLNFEIIFGDSYCSFTEYMNIKDKMICWEIFLYKATGIREGRAMNEVGAPEADGCGLGWMGTRKFIELLSFHRYSKSCI